MIFQNQPFLVSVVIPTYNRGYVLMRAIDSVLKSTYQNFEIIVVDDTSTDNTPDVVRAIQDSRVQYIRHEKNAGVSAARNTGIKASQGILISFLDSDDEFLPDKMRLEVETFKTASRRIGMVASNHYDQLGDGKLVVAIKETNERRIFPMPSTWVLRKEVFDKIGLFDVRIVAGGEDAEFMRRFRQHYRFHFMREPLIIKNTMADNFFSDKEKIIKLRRQVVTDVKGEPRLYAHMLFTLAKELWGHGDKKEAREYFLKAFWAYPVKIGYLLRYLTSFLKR